MTELECARRGEVTSLVEEPVPLLGTFEARYDRSTGNQGGLFT